MANGKQFERFLDALAKVTKTAGEQGLKVSIEIQLGPSSDEDEPADDSTTIHAISDITGTHHHGAETDTYLGFSSPAGNQYWDDEELNK